MNPRALSISLKLRYGEREVIDGTIASLSNVLSWGEPVEDERALLQVGSQAIARVARSS